MGERRTGCDVVEPLLSAWIDGELERDEAEGVAAHVARCAACADVAGELAAVTSMLGNLPVRSAPAELVASPPPSPPAGRWPALRRARALAVVTGLLMGALLALGAGDEPHPVPAPLDAFVADQLDGVVSGQRTTQVILETRP